MKNGDWTFDFMARREDWQEGVSLFAKQGAVGQTAALAQPLMFKVIEPGTRVEPFATLNIQSAQRLMDELWQCGLRPTEGAGSAGAMAATQRHLEDMRKLVFENG